MRSRRHSDTTLASQSKFPNGLINFSTRSSTAIMVLPVRKLGNKLKNTLNTKNKINNLVVIQKYKISEKF